MKRILCNVALLLVSLQAHATVRTLQVTLGAAATPLFTSGGLPVKWVIFQNNAAATMHLGDSQVTASRGLQLLAGGGSFYQGATVGQTNLAGWYVLGTTGQVLDVIYDDGQ